jgi:hypothetical protein
MTIIPLTAALPLECSLTSRKALLHAVFQRWGDWADGKENGSGEAHSIPALSVLK